MVGLDALGAVHRQMVFRRIRRGWRREACGPILYDVEVDKNGRQRFVYVCVERS